jgi:shikimate kinase
MGSGKTTVGTALAGALGREFLDSDRMLEARTGLSGREIADSEGIETLHRLELDVLREALGSVPAPVIAAAASVLDGPEGSSLLEGVYCVWLTAAAEVLAVRAAEGERRRVIGPGESLGHRAARYERAADVVIDTSRLSPDESVDRVLAGMEERGLQ